MKKIPVVILCIFCILNAFTACTGIFSDSLNCDLCDKKTRDVVHTYDDMYICYSCAINHKYTKCWICENYYVVDHVFSSDAYCSNCYEAYTHSCFLCWSSCIEPAKLIINDEEYYICNICVAQYFENVDPIKPCYFCIECGEVFGGKYYEHSLYDEEKICASCVLNANYEQCSICKKYNTDLINNVCGLCRETN